MKNSHDSAISLCMHSLSLFLILKRAECDYSSISFVIITKEDLFYLHGIVIFAHRYCLCFVFYVFIFALCA